MKTPYHPVHPLTGLRSGLALLILVPLLSIEPLQAQQAVRVETIPQAEVIAFASEAGHLYAATYSQVYRSDNGGDTWDQAAALPDETSDINALIANDGVLYVGTVESGVVASLNGGDSWTPYTTGLAGLSLRITAFAVRGDSLYAGTDGAGVQVLNLQNPISWQSFNAGLSAQGIEALVVSGDVLVASGGISGNVYVRDRQDDMWTTVALDPQDPQNHVLSFLASDLYLIGGTAKGIFRSNSNGESWVSNPDALPASSDVLAMTQYGARIYAAVQQQGFFLYSSDDQGGTWTLRNQQAMPVFDLLSSPDRLWIGRADGLWYYDLATSPRMFQATLISELPGYPVKRGVMLGTLDGGNFRTQGFFYGLTAPWIQIELYRGDPDNGGEAIKTWITVPEGGGSNGSLAFDFLLTAEQEQDLLDGQLSLYVRTLGNRSQDISGPIQVLPLENPQLLETSISYFLSGMLNRMGGVLATLEGNNLRMVGFGMFLGPVGRVDVYQGALGETGEYKANIFLNFGVGSETNMWFDHTLPLSDELKQSLLDGHLYLEFVTFSEIRPRAQLLLSPNQAPAASQITVPSEGATITIGGAAGQDPIDPETPLTEIAFTSASDPEGNAVGYIWQASGKASFDFRNFAMEVESGSTTIPLTVAEAAALFDMISAGLPPQTPLTLYHRMITTDGALYTYGEASTVTLVRGTITSNEPENDLPDSFSLHGNYPNPFNPSTTVVFDLPAQAEVHVEVFDLLGRQVLTVPAGILAAGARHSIEIDGASLSSGSYLYRVSAQSANNVHVATGTMTLIK